MSGVATAIVGGAVLGAIVSNKSANTQASAVQEAAQTQAQSTREATQIQQNALDKQIALNKPFYDVGVNATNKLAAQTPYTPDAFNYQADPGYAFRFNEGMKGLNATAAARGGLISGNALRAGTDYGQRLGSQEYQNAYDRYLTGNQQKLQAYNTNTAIQQNLASMGQGSANNQAAAAGTFGNSAAGNTIGAGNALAGGISGAGMANAAGMTGGANAISGGIGTYLNYNQNQNMINALNNRNMSAYANQAMNQYGAGNVYGYGGQGTYNLSPAMFDVPGGV